MSKFDPMEAGTLGIEVEAGMPVGLRGRFVMPPFSVLDSKQGWWQARKRAWLSLGIQSEIGRKGDLLNADTRDWDKEWKSGDAVWGGHGTSIFDPVVCELVYRWFLPGGVGNVLDPFAGGSVRGIVAAMLGVQYVGVDLSGAQVAANEAQWKQMLEKNPAARGQPNPVWIEGDGLDVRSLTRARFDLVFTCPPYGDLEVYSDDPRDISNMDHDEFLFVYDRIIAAACSRLKQDGFAAIVVGDFRDKEGFYRSFPANTTMGFHRAGLKLYNDAILYTSIGSLPLRTRKQFNAGRKLGKAHQNLLVFYKGNPANIKAKFGEVQTKEDATNEDQS